MNYLALFETSAIAGYVVLSFVGLVAFIAILRHHERVVSRLHAKQAEVDELRKVVDQLERAIEGRLHQADPAGNGEGERLAG